MGCEPNDRSRGAGDVVRDAPAAIIRAVLHTGDVCTHYRRAGRGPALLLLVGACSAHDEGRERLLLALARFYRVVMPEIPRSDALRPPDPADATELSAWLRDFVDGLGLTRPTLVADACVAGAALCFTLHEPDRAGPLLVLPGTLGS